MGDQSPLADPAFRERVLPLTLDAVLSLLDKYEQRFLDPAKEADFQEWLRNGGPTRAAAEGWPALTPTQERMFERWGGFGTPKPTDEDRRIMKQTLWLLEQWVVPALRTALGIDPT
jgi:hypothetical protein